MDPIVAQIRIDNFHVALMHCPTNAIDRLMRPALGPKAIGLRMKIRFPNRHQHHV
jgi:hypothetical protein